MTRSGDIPKMNLYKILTSVGQVKRYLVTHEKHVESDWYVHPHNPIKSKSKYFGCTNFIRITKTRLFNIMALFMATKTKSFR